MAVRYFNWKLATVLVVAFGVFVAAACALHRWQVGARAVQALPLGEAAYARQDYDEAASQLGKYLAINADDVEVLLKYADAQLKRRPSSTSNTAQAVNAYRAVLRLDNRNLKAAQGLIELYLPFANSAGEAELVAQHFLENNDDARIRRLHAEALRLLRRPKEAVAELKKNLERHPADVQSYERMGALAEQNPEMVDKPAAFWFEDAIAKNPQSALAYIARAGFHLRHNENDKAVADLGQAQKCDLPDTETRSRLAGGLINAKLLDTAREQLRAWQAKDPTEPLLWQYWAELASQANDVALRASDSAAQARSVEEMYTVAEEGVKALAAQPWDFMPRATELLVASGHLQEAKDRIAQMRQKGVAPAAVPYLEGLIADKEGRPRDAIVDWRNAISLGYKAPESRWMLVLTLARLGDTQSAIDELRILLTQIPGFLKGRLALAQFLVQTKEWPEVLNQARQAQQLSESDPKAHTEATVLELQARTQLLTADTRPEAERNKDWQEVETQLAQLDKAENGSLPTRLLQAQVALVRGKFSEATTLLTDLESKYPSEVRVMLLQAEMAAAQEKKEEARTRFQAAVAKFPQAVEPVRSLALFLSRQNQRQDCETVIKEGFTRIQEPRLRRDLGLTLADFYRQWKDEEKLTLWLNDLIAQFPSDIQLRRLFLTRDEIRKDPVRTQRLIDEIKSLEGETGWQWRYEQARLWSGSGADEFKTRYAQTVKLLQENLLTNPKDHASRLLLAQTYERANELPLAAATYQEVQRAVPNNVPVLVRTVAALYKVKDNDGARRLLAQAEQQNLRSPELDKLRLQDDLLQGRLTEAEEALVKLVSRDPNDVSSHLSLALVLIQAKKYDEAQKILDTLKVKMPDSMEVLGAQVGLYVEQDRAAEAIGLCDQIVDKLRSVPAYTLRARVYVALKQRDLRQYGNVSEDYDGKTLADLGRIIALDPQKADSWAARADFYRGIGRTREGLADIRKALELAPDNLTIQRLASLLFLASGDPSLLGEADALLDRALATFEKSPPTSAEGARMADYTQLRMLKARAFMLRGTGPSIEGARRLLREVTNSQPKAAEAWQWLAELELRQEDPAKAADVAMQGLTYNPDNGVLLLLKARAEKVRQPAVAALTLKVLLDQDPNNVDVLLELADAYARAGRTPQAVELLNRKLSAFKGLARRRCEIVYAEVLYANGQRDEAKALFEKLTQADPNDPMPTMSLAQQLRRERRWTEMNQLVQRWLSTHPKDADVARSIAQVLAASDDKQALLMAEDILRTTLERNPRSTSSLLLLAMMMQDAGRNEEAVRLNRRVLELDPKSVIAMNNLAWILCDQEGQPDQYKEAIELAEKGLVIVPDHGDLLDTRGYARYRLGDFDRAIADFTKCIELSPANTPVSAMPRFHLAMTYAAMKRQAEAIGHMQKALELNRANLRIAREQDEVGRAAYAVRLIKDALRLQDQMTALRTALGLADDLGPSAQELADAKALLERLQKGI